jgi:hypothetical protein
MTATLHHVGLQEAASINELLVGVVDLEAILLLLLRRIESALLFLLLRSLPGLAPLPFLSLFSLFLLLFSLLSSLLGEFLRPALIFELLLLGTDQRLSDGGFVRCKAIGLG